MPDALRVPVNFPHPVERDVVDLPFCIGELEGLRALFGKAQLPEGDQDDPALRPVVIPQLEVASGELGVPSDAIEQFVNRDHALGMAVSALVFDADPRFQHPGAVAFRALGWFVQLLFREFEAARAAAGRFDDGPVFRMLETAHGMSWSLDILEDPTWAKGLEFYQAAAAWTMVWQVAGALPVAKVIGWSVSCLRNSVTKSRHEGRLAPRRHLGKGA